MRWSDASCRWRFSIFFCWGFSGARFNSYGKNGGGENKPVAHCEKQKEAQKISKEWSKEGSKEKFVKSAEVGTRNFFLRPQSQFRNLKEALPQSQFCNFLRNVAPQLRNRKFFLKSATSTPQLESFTSGIVGTYIFRRGVTRNIYIFTTRWFLLLKGFKGTIARVFQLLKFV
jgi:hypothetical protein